MIQSVIGPNAALRYLKAYHAHVDYWREVNPTTALGMVDKPEHTVFIEQYMEALPNTLVVGRVHHDQEGGFHLAPSGEGDTRQYVCSPVDYHNAYGFLGRKRNGILHVMNEPDGFADDATIQWLVSWMIEYIGMATQARTKSVLFNWGDRQPRLINGMMDERYDDVLKIMAICPELFFMGMHFYGPDSVTEHLESYVKRCEKLGITPPRVIGTEFGFDKTDGQENGYVSRGYSGGAFAGWEIRQCKRDLLPFFKSGVLIGVDGFQEGNSGGWENFDTENDKGYKDEIKRSALAGELNVMTSPVSTTKPSYTPQPFTAGAKYTLHFADNARHNVRTAPIVAGDNLLVKMDDKTVVKIHEQKAIGIDYWIRISAESVENGWMNLYGGIVTYTPVPEPAVPVTPKPEPAPIPVPPVEQPKPDPVPPKPETLYTYTLSFSLRSPEIDPARLTAIENGIRAIVSGVAWLGAGIGTSEVYVKVKQTAAAP